MKLRNKKTGEVITNAKITLLPWTQGVRGCHVPLYSSIAEFKEDWEDYTPKQPIIKDEKIRKAVRAWWDCCQEGIEDKRIYIKDAEFRMGIYRLDLGRYYFFDDKNEGFYTLAELCGEEE